MNKDKFSIEYESIEDYIKARTVVEEGSAGGGSGGTFIHSELEGLDYESSGHTGFASTEDLYEQTDVFADMVAESEESVLGVIGEPEEGTVSADIASLKASVSAVEDKLQEVLNKFMPQPDAPDPEVPSYIPEYYVLATDEDFSGTTDGSFVYVGTDEYVIVPYRIKGVVVRSYYRMFYEKAVKGVASYSNKVNTIRECFSYAGITGQPLELKYFNVSSVFYFTGAFQYCKASELDLSSWRTPKLISITSLFNYCEALYINVAGWNTENATSFYYLFNECKATVVDGLGDWSNASVGGSQAYDYAFYRCSIIEADFSGFTTPFKYTGSPYNVAAYFTPAVVYAATQEDADWMNSWTYWNIYNATVKEEV